MVRKLFGFHLILLQHLAYPLTRFLTLKAAPDGLGSLLDPESSTYLDHKMHLTGMVADGLGSLLDPESSTFLMPKRTWRAASLTGLGRSNRKGRQNSQQAPNCLISSFIF